MIPVITDDQATGALQVFSDYLASIASYADFPNHVSAVVRRKLESRWPSESADGSLVVLGR